MTAVATTPKQHHTFIFRKDRRTIFLDSLAWELPTWNSNPCFSFLIFSSISMQYFALVTL